MTSSKGNTSKQFLNCGLGVILLVTIASSLAVPEAGSNGRSQRETTRFKRDWHFPGGDQKGWHHPAVLQPIQQRDRTPARGAPLNSRPRPPHSRPKPITRPVATPSCACGESRISQIEEQIVILMKKTEVLTSQTTESRVNIEAMSVTNRQLQARISQVVREKQALERQTREMHPLSSSLARDNERLRADNERLMAEQLRREVGAADTRAADTDVQDEDETVFRESSLRELNDVMGNREAEMIEMGLAKPAGPPRRPEGKTEAYGARLGFSRGPDDETEDLATSMLALNQENENLARKMESLERRLSQQQRETQRGVMAGPQIREHTPQRESDEILEKIARLERLVLVALQAPPAGEADDGRTYRVGGAQVSRPMGSGAAGRMKVPSAAAQHDAGPTRGHTGDVSVVDTMSEEDLNAMANVVESVRGKSPRKCAFSVASTGITLGIDGEATVLEFDHEFVNKGGDFNMRANRFVCEHPGFYFVTFTVRSYDHKYLGVCLMKNDDIQTSVYTDSSDRNVMQTQSVLLHLDAGDLLWLRNPPSTNFAVHSGDKRYVTFSGFLVYRGA